MPKRQKVLVLYLADSSLESNVIAWAHYDGTGQTLHMSGDSDVPPYPTGLDALLDGWRLFHMSALRPEPTGDELTTSYLKYEFAFEKRVKIKRHDKDDRDEGHERNEKGEKDEKDEKKKRKKKKHEKDQKKDQKKDESDD